MHGSSAGKADISRFFWKHGWGCTYVGARSRGSLNYCYKMADAVVIAGGGDVSPHLYGQGNLYARNISQARDLDEMQALDWALRDNKPVLGICRGMQIMAVHSGASLHQSIAHTGITKHQHVTGYHHAFTIPGTVLADILEYERIQVNSRHHQAIDEESLPMGWDITCYSHDSLIEGIAHRDLPWMGVQWHPESMIGSKNSDAIFDWLRKQID